MLKFIDASFNALFFSSAHTKNGMGWGGGGFCVCVGGGGGRLWIKQSVLI